MCSVITSVSVELFSYITELSSVMLQFSVLSVYELALNLNVTLEDSLLSFNGSVVFVTTQAITPVFPLSPESSPEPPLPPED